MAFNKFTQIVPAKYDARSLQETLYLPTLKRKQHDQLDESLAKTDVELSKFDNLDLHDPIVQAEKERLRKRIDQQTSKLARQGVNSGSKSEFIDLATEYGKATSINGKIGKAKMIKEKYLKDREEIKQRMIQGQYSPEDAQRFLDLQFEKYKKEYKGEDLEEINLMDAPKYMDIETKFRELIPAVGQDVKTKIRNKGYRVVERGNSLVYMTPKGSYQTKTNDEQLNHLLNLLNDEFVKEGADGRRSLDIQQVSPEQAANKINDLIGMAKIDVENNTERFAYQVRNKPTPTDPDKSDGTSLGRSTVGHNADIFNYESFGQLKAASIPDNPNDKESVAKARQHGRNLKIVESYLVGNSEFQKLNSEIGELDQDLNDIQQQKQRVEVLKQQELQQNPPQKGTNNPKLSGGQNIQYSKEYQNLQEEARELNSQYIKIKNQVDNKQERINNIAEGIMSQEVFESSEIDLYPQTSGDNTKQLEFVKKIAKDEKSNKISSVSITENSDDSDRVKTLDLTENEVFAQQIKEDIGGNRLLQSKINDVSLVNNGLSAGIKIQFQVSEEYADKYDELEKNEFVTMVIEPNELMQNNVPTYLTQYVNDVYGKEALKTIQANINSNKEPAANTIEELGQYSQPSSDYYPMAEQGVDLTIDFLNLPHQEGNATKLYETPFEIKEENGTTTKNQITISKYLNKLQSDDEFDNVIGSSEQYTRFLSTIYNNLIKTKAIPNKSFNDMFIKKVQGGIEFDEDKFLDTVGDYPILLDGFNTKNKMRLIANKLNN